jgi:hypothetical protein
MLSVLPMPDCDGDLAETKMRACGSGARKHRKVSMRGAPAAAWMGLIEPAWGAHWALVRLQRVASAQANLLLWRESREAVAELLGLPHGQSIICRRGLRVELHLLELRGAEQSEPPLEGAQQRASRPAKHFVNCDGSVCDGSMH